MAGQVLLVLTLLCRTGVRIPLQPLNMHPHVSSKTIVLLTVDRRKRDRAHCPSLHLLPQLRSKRNSSIFALTVPVNLNSITDRGLAWALGN